MQIYLLYPLFLNINQHLTLLAVELKPQNRSILHAQELRFVGHWIDFSAYGSDKDAKADELLKLIKRVADGEMTKNEILGNREIAIFKDGVTL